MNPHFFTAPFFSCLIGSPSRRKHPGHAGQCVKTGRGENDDEEDLDRTICDPAAGPDGIHISRPSGSPQHEDGKDGHDDAAERSCKEDGIHEAHGTEEGEQEWREDDEGEHRDPGRDMEFILQLELVDHIRQEAF